MSNVEKLHEKMSALSLGDLLLIAVQAINLGMDDKRVDLILKYVKMGLIARDMRLQIEPTPTATEAEGER